MILSEYEGADHPEVATEEISNRSTTSFDTSKKITEQRAANGSIIAKIGMGAGKVVAIFNQAARESVQTMLNTVIPFMAFVSLLIGIIQGSGIGKLLANTLSPLAGNIWGLMFIGFQNV